jgi:hypothetical protein
VDVTHPGWIGTVPAYLDSGIDISDIALRYDSPAVPVVCKVPDKTMAQGVTDHLANK